MTLTPVHLFTVLDADLDLVRTERPTYSDRVEFEVAAHGTIVR